ncbi:MAG: excinuclease ABC subunit UvrC [Clostridia bacterium]|nr:excinuclease ABC subunit UvrC [Clostridia bacterium]
MKDVLESKIKLLPKSPGVYVMQDEEGTVIYVGKAKNLKNRVTQYFRNGLKTEKVSAMVRSVDDFYYILTHTERDALSLENNLIKKHKPKYNILLKDDKSYPYIRVDLKEEFPRFTVVRRIKKDGAKYFGPYMLSFSVNDVLDIVKEAYKIRPCSKNLGAKAKRECLNYHLGLCLAPCANKCTREEYLKNVRGAIDFLSGNDDIAEKVLQDKMLTLASNEEFERALFIKQRLEILKKIKEKKITALNRFITADVVSVKSDGLFASIAVLFVRGGKSMGVKCYQAETFSGEGEERLNEFLSAFYDGVREIPNEIITEYAVSDALKAKIEELAGRKVTFTIPEKAVKKSLLEMAEKNASEYLDNYIDKIVKKHEVRELSLLRLKKELHLSKTPTRMECYDISHISGVDKVGAMVVFTNGEPDKNEYRRFKIQTVEGNDDFASLQEVLRRRLSKLSTSEEGKFPRPDLIVIDGGKGQLSSVKEVFDELSIEGIDLISIAEREEEIFTLYSENSIKLPKSDKALQMLIRLRDETHRFAITFNRNLRTKRTLSSMLTEIEGIGKVKRDALMDKFKDISALISASVEEIAKTEGIGEKLANNIKDYLNQAKTPREKR